MEMFVQAAAGQRASRKLSVSGTVFFFIAEISSFGLPLWFDQKVKFWA